MQIVQSTRALEVRGRLAGSIYGPGISGERKVKLELSERYAITGFQKQHEFRHFKCVRYSKLIELRPLSQILAKTDQSLTPQVRLSPMLGMPKIYGPQIFIPVLCRMRSLGDDVI